MDVWLSNARVRLTDANLLGEGGEARVYRSGDRAVKIFHAPSAVKAQKLAAFPRHLPPEVVAPGEPARDRSGTVIGYAMPAVLGHEELARLSNRRWREGRGYLRTATKVSTLFSRLATVLSRLHGAGVVVGDLNDGNVLFAPGTAQGSRSSTPTRMQSSAGSPARSRTSARSTPRSDGRALDFTRRRPIGTRGNVLLFSSPALCPPLRGRAQDAADAAAAR